MYVPLPEEPCFLEQHTLAMWSFLPQLRHISSLKRHEEGLWPSLSQQ